jgi:three-Cys-motif partner protein
MGASAMTQDAFGGKHTVEKLDRLEEYLERFLTVFKNIKWVEETVYFDAFAGTGEVPKAGTAPTLPLDCEDQEFIVGSALRALRLKSCFGRYVFVEMNKKKAAELKARLAAQFPEKMHLIEVRSADANEALRTFCNEPKWSKRRAVVFLDPCGSQVSWATLELLATTKAVDVWYLFPAFWGVTRQMGKKGSVHETHRASLDRLVGTDAWRALIKTRTEPQDLFGHVSEQTYSDADADVVTEFMIERMKQIFKGGVLDDWLPLGKDNSHRFSLIFACANPSPNANSLAMRLARAVMRSGRRGRAK